MTVDLGRFRTFSPRVSNSSRSHSIECPACKRTVRIPDGLVLRTRVKDARTFCHEIVDPQTGAVRERGAML
jgi:hypothetical protein